MLRAVCVVPAIVAAVMLVEGLQRLVEESAYCARLIESRALPFVHTCGNNCEEVKGG
jgi:hypothetical protein